MNSSLQIPPSAGDSSGSATGTPVSSPRNYPQSAGPTPYTHSVPRPTSVATPHSSSSHNNYHNTSGNNNTHYPSNTTNSQMNSPPTASSAARRQRASHTVVSPNQQHHHHQSHQPTQNRRGDEHYNQANNAGNSTPATANSGAGGNGGNPGAAGMPDVYAHPAAVAYAAAHPRRTIPKFGPYLLLQTLGEGEFGKVKLGLHSQWGEEVAVKLIRRGNVDSSVRMGKVEREIEVLKTLKHPNIVRLYDVIETDKYIGIILEYASGGELFDHILAHRYLREKDAARLFSQLISGVWYIHQKKIVHRDLKLENLLLDRNRNVIITDFGFANRFEHKSDDLMQTSCGSPCYAAPELVISEGLYVGSAVDIWSCGVILYAMLAGYLPFDDDPANPDGDNINLLYKYIVSTPLSFPDYISTEARDLLSMMLVPDPKRRTTLDGVMRHVWLKPYWGSMRTDGVPNSFGRSVDDLERQAMEQHQMKRVAYQRQMRAQAQAVSSQQGAGAGTPAGGATGAGQVGTTPSRSQSHRPEPRTATADRDRSAVSASVHPVPPPSATRSRSTQPEYLYESPSPTSGTPPAIVDNSVSLLTSPPPSTAKPSTTTGHASGSGSGKQPGTPNNAGSGTVRGSKFDSPAKLGLSEDDPFAYGGTTAVPAPPVTSNITSAGATLSPPPHASGQGQGQSAPPSSAKTGGGFRHTIQVEYDEPKGAGGTGSRRGRGRAGSQSGQGQGTPEKEKERENTKPLPTPPHAQQGQDQVQPAPSSYRSLASAGATSTAATPIVPAVPTTLVPHPPTASVVPPTPISAYATQDSIRDKESPASTLSKEKDNSQRGHNKGKSSIDRIGLGKIFGLGLGGDKTEKEKDKETASLQSVQSPSVNVSQPDSDQGQEKNNVEVVEKEKEKGKEKKKTNRRNTLTVMVEPFSRSIRGKSGAQTPGGKGSKGTHTPISSVYPEIQTAKAPQPPLPTQLLNAPESARSTSVGSVPGSVAPSTASASAVSGTSASASAFSPSQEFGDAPLTGVDARGAMQASTSKAKKVMQWFRSKSKGRESLGVGVSPGGSSAALSDDEDGTSRDGRGEKEATPTHSQTGTTTSNTPIANRYRKGYSTSSSTVNQDGAKEERGKQQGQGQNLAVPPTVQVVVSTPMSAVSRPPSTPLGSTASHVPTTTPVASSFVSRLRNSVAVGSRDRERKTSTSSNKHAWYASASNNNGPNSTNPPLPPHPYAQLRIHHGAVDQTTITTRPPPEVMAHVRRVLESMGVDAQLESEYKVRCVRVKKKDAVGPNSSSASGSAAVPSAAEGGAPGLAVVTMMGSAASNGVDKRGLPLPSPSATFSASSTGGMLRGLLMRRQSSQVSSSHGHTGHGHGHGGHVHQQQGSTTLAFDDEHSVVVGEPLAMNGPNNNSTDLISPIASPGQGAFPWMNGSSESGSKVGPAYGDISQDAGDEVRFSVELTRLDRLNDTYSLDIRRLKGNLKSYKFLYDTLRERADLSATHA